MSAKMISERAITTHQLLEYLDISRYTLYGLIKKGIGFPEPEKVGKSCIWDKKEVDDWLEWMSRRGMQVKGTRNQKSELAGKTFGKLKVIGDSGKRKSGRVIWDCRCECGEKTTAMSSQLNNGHKKSCGCLHGAHLKANYDRLTGQS